MCAVISYEPHTALARVAATAVGQSETRHELVGRWGARAIFKTGGAYMTKESHNNQKVDTFMVDVAHIQISPLLRTNYETDSRISVQNQPISAKL
jgi:hypothetical protein